MTALLPRLKTRLGITDDSGDALLYELLDSAMWAYLELRYPAGRYPFDGEGEPVIERIAHGWILDAAVEMYSKQGAEGQISHSENGVSRAYESAGLSAGLRLRVTPVAGVIR